MNAIAIFLNVAHSFRGADSVSEIQFLRFFEERSSLEVRWTSFGDRRRYIRRRDRLRQGTDGAQRYAKGRDAAPSSRTRQGAGPEELMNIYMEHMYAEQFKRASHPVFFGHAVHTVLDIAGIDNATSWTHGALFRYRSRADLIEIALHPSSYERHEYKIAALTKTIAYPIEPTIYLSDLRFLALLIMSLISVSIIAMRR